MCYAPESLYTPNDLACMLGATEERLKKILHMMRLFRPDRYGWVPYRDIPAELQNGLRRRCYSYPSQHNWRTRTLEPLITRDGVNFILGELEKQFRPMLDNIEAMKGGEL